MNTGRKASLVLALACLLAFSTASAGFAQDSGASATISIENGYLGGYKISSSNVGSALDFAIGFALSDALTAKLVFVQGDLTFDSYRLFGLAYHFAPKLSLTTLVGQGTASGNVVGLGMGVDLLSRVVSGTLQTGLELNVGYLAPVASYGAGVINFGVSASVGF